ncbi:G-type lectin S-receptor-like serine/threonine-protein kinase [Prunus yedoensis var. nudiflora]|uniref:Receptor-like serine/threonine-protein kinase n=1 Tax=Prunus yedoensis var. nudiflora TaxID=2094558 RepID=A0A314YPW4_PRUYE|nr:G-type lectin S-receptor-like serine/threonine-protein kinase [Prunus yedoensis var. nudiflora]
MQFVKGLLNALVFQLLLLQLCSSLDTISFDQSIRDGDFLVSKNETFVLGFFTPGTSSNRYVGIWYKFSENMVFWLANRDNPLNDTSGVLSINTDGNLILAHGNSSQGLPLWSTNVSVSSSGNNNVVAQLLDSGNFVLVQQDNQNVLWQSSDHPTNALLSSMKLGLDKKSGINRFLTSWNSNNDPGTGNCSLRMDTNGSPQLILYKNQAKWWRSGQWNGIQWGGIPAESGNNVFKINFVNNQDEIAVQWSVLDPSIYSVITIDGTGSLNQLSWQGQQHQWVTLWSAPLDACDSYGKCGQFGDCNPYTNSGFNCTCYPGYEPNSPQDWDLRDGTGGCKRPQGSPSMCRNGEGFVKMENVKVPDTSTIKLNRSLSLEACGEECLRNCSCLAYASADVRNGGSGCMAWFGDLMDTKQFTEGGQDLYIRADALVLAQYTKKSGGGFSAKDRRLAIILGVFIAVTSLLIVAALCWFRKRSRKGRGGQPELLNDAIAGSRSHDDLLKKNEVNEHRGKTDLPFFDLSTIVAATDYFSSANLLGHGGFGMVYKGCLADGQEIAVKRLSRNSGQGVEEFKNEVMLIAKLQHRNLVRLLGCCIDKEERMLIYEYMPNRSLDLCIFDKTRRSLLDWRKRFQIIIGIARGVLYLHQDSRLKIIHRDLKASNVLLDASMNPKISDFGMARMFGDDQIEANTNRVVGTYGYMSPEYAMEGRYSEKSDVFSFGVLLLEIISGKRNTSYDPSPNLIGQIWDMWTEEQALAMVDPSLGESYPAHEVSRCIQIGLLCVQESASDRPTMSEVIFMLGNETTLPYPKKPAFILQSSSKLNSAASKGSTPSLNDVTMTVLKAR